MFASRLTPEQWAEARRLRAEGTTLAAIGKQFGVNATSIAYRARREGWPAPPKPAGKRNPLARRQVSADVRRRLTQRLYNIIDSKLELMELRMRKQLKQAKEAVKGSGDIPAGDEEQDSSSGASPPTSSLPTGSTASAARSTSTSASSTSCP
jgi:hypothetical protein